MLGSPMLYLKGVRILMFQLSGFYYKSCSQGVYGLRLNSDYTSRQKAPSSPAANTTLQNPIPPTTIVCERCLRKATFVADLLRGEQSLLLADALYVSKTSLRLRGV